MSVVVVTPPDPFVDLEMTKAHLRVDDDDSDTLIEAYIAAACAHIDGPAAWLGRAIGAQTLELRRDDFPSCPLRLPNGPIVSLTSVKYLDADGAEQTLAADQYQLLTDGRLALAYGASWPSARSTSEAVRIRYAAGYATVPAPIVAAVLLMVGDMYSRRETTGPDGAAIQMSATVNNLLGPFKVWSV